MECSISFKIVPSIFLNLNLRKFINFLDFFLKKIFFKDSKLIEIIFSSNDSKHEINISKYYYLHSEIISSTVALFVAFDIAQRASFLTFY